MAQELAQIEKFQFTEKGLTINGQPTLEECGMAFDYIYFWGKMAPIYMGDLLNYMEQRWGDGYAQILDPTRYSYQTVANRKSVMRRVRQAVRQEGLYFSHYAAVAALDEPQQKRLLEKAAKKGWDTTDTRLEANKEKRKKEQPILLTPVKIDLTLSLQVPENMIDKIYELGRSWVSRLRVYDVKLLDVQIRRVP